MKSIRDTYRHLPSAERRPFTWAVAGSLAAAILAIVVYAGLLAELGRVWAGWASKLF